MDSTLNISTCGLRIGVAALFLALYTYQSVFQQNVKSRLVVFIFRIVVAYLMTALVVGLVLLCLDKLPMLEDPITSLKRIIVITMPASMGAIVVDSFDKE
ncbi:hypothetical protein LA52FAK_41280 [Desulforhopalus sp. 52FAK]